MVVEFKGGRWVRPGRHDASSWTGNAEIAAAFAQPMEDEAEGWDVVMVADTDDDNGHFVPIDYDGLMQNEHESKEDEIYEAAFKKLADKYLGDVDDDHPFMQAEDADEIRYFDPDELDPDDEEDAKKIKDAKRWEEAREELEENYHYAAEDLSLEGSFADASVYSNEEERLAVGPVRLSRVYVFPSGSDADDRARVLGRLGEEMYDGELDEKSGATKMAAEKSERPKRRGGKKKKPRVDRFNVSADDVFGSDEDDRAKKVAAAWVRRAVAMA
jgi:hypothetical protein